jgi:hypothetical protein
MSEKSHLPGTALNGLETRERRRQVRRRWPAPLLLLAFVLLRSAAGRCQQPSHTDGHADGQGPVAEAATPAGSPAEWAEAATRNELRIIDEVASYPVRYRQRKVDDRGDTTRELIESAQGSVARLVARNGNALTAAEDAAERQRLKEALNSPEEFSRHHKRDRQTRDMIVQLVREMPSAMIFTYAPGQPQMGQGAKQVVLDLTPNPAFRPPTMISDLLTGFAGRIWIDAKTMTLLRAEGHVLKPIHVGWGGMVANIFPGGTVEFEQSDSGNNHWVFTQADEHLTLRELMVHTVPFDSKVESTDFRPLPGPVSYQDAIRMLLAEPLATR